MPSVDFNEEDAFEIIGVLRDRMRRNGYGFVDERAMRLANAASSASPNGPSERQRLVFYLDELSSYFKENGATAYQRAIDGINAQLDRESPTILGAVVEVPDGTGVYRGHAEIGLERLVMDDQTVIQLDRAIQVIRVLVLDGWLPDTNGEGTSET